jgi:crotonobetainyl-CoA:carnitine CoA-transferase CaiB-like acyl-CoA transferase
MNGIRVLDMSAVISGPWAASVLADQGADVIKIESPTGPDLTRSLGPGAHEGMGAMYVTANRGKRSITLDLQKTEGVSAFKKLVAQSDVVIANYRPGVAERLGVDYGSLVGVNKDLIMLSISGYGDTGPYVKARVFDQVIQTMTGVGTLMKDANGDPTMFHNLLMDKVTALNAAQCVTSALLAKERGHGGQHINLSMLDSAVHFLFPDGYLNKVCRFQVVMCSPSV